MAKPTIKKPAEKAQTTPATPEVEIDKAVVGETETTEEKEGVEELNEELGESEPATEEEKDSGADKAEETPAEKKPEVKVDTTINEQNKPMENVKIRMAKDHSCVIAMERYDLKAGKTYIVPRNVRNILNRHGLLKPL